ncbi:MAG: hypothetical protein CL920_03390 [Deltaproteobacteria bacterium]|nr:hypothetical protein [Deltaproteobacteria bacterium]|tara:strand:+ start:1611 stop:3773 length:2163 start_codon:yes stop_codon:yes gene_type:complete
MTSQKQIEQVLLKRGFVTPDQLVKARAAQSKNHADIGHILVGMDLLTRDELRQVIQIARQEDDSFADTMAPTPVIKQPGPSNTRSAKAIGQITPKGHTPPKGKSSSPTKKKPSSGPIKKAIVGNSVCPRCNHKHLRPESVCHKCNALMMPQQKKDKLVGKTLGERYLLNGKLGAGGMGMVYHATDTEADEFIAVKILPMQLNTDEQVLKRFQREADVQASLKHPHIVRTIGHGVEEDIGCYLAMELLVGQDFKAYQKKHLALGAPELLRFFGHVCDAMSHSHKIGVIHRDLKPANIFLGHNDIHPLEQVKIIDFGIAKLTSDEVTQLTATGMFLGTPSYMSPEQASGQKQLDHRSDIYTLGIILFETLTGQTPFLGEHLAKILMDHIYTQPPQLNQLRPNVHFPAKLQNFMDSVLAKDPDARPSSMQEFKERLEDAVNSASKDFWGPVPAQSGVERELEESLHKEANKLLTEHKYPPLPEGLTPMQLFSRLALRMRDLGDNNDTLTSALVGALLDQDMHISSPSLDALPASSYASLDSIPAVGQTPGTGSHSSLPHLPRRQTGSVRTLRSKRSTQAKGIPTIKPPVRTLKPTGKNRIVHPPPGAAKRGNSRRGQFLFLIVFVAIAIGGIGFFVWSQLGKKKTPPTKRSQITTRRTPPNIRGKATKTPAQKKRQVKTRKVKKAKTRKRRRIRKKQTKLRRTKLRRTKLRRTKSRKRPTPRR